MKVRFMYLSVRDNSYAIVIYNYRIFRTQHDTKDSRTHNNKNRNYGKKLVLSVASQSITTIITVIVMRVLKNLKR